MYAILSTGYLRVFVLTLLPAYFGFLVVAAILDRRLSSYCKRNRIEKTQAFVISNRVPKKAFDAFLNRLPTADRRVHGLIWWLRGWRFASDVFFWLFVVVFVLGTLSVLKS